MRTIVLVVLIGLVVMGLLGRALARVHDLWEPACAAYALSQVNLRVVRYCDSRILVLLDEQGVARYVVADPRR